jgi:hypothetical protein
MITKQKKAMPHPDDFMVVTVALAFQAKLNPEVEDPMPFDAIGIEETLAAADAADYLEKMVSAIRERRLYGLMLQEQAESAVGAGDWIEKTFEDIMAEAAAESLDERSTNAPTVAPRRDL